MFNVYLGDRRNEKCLDFTVQIEGCPPDGIAAIDFRRANGLPEAPSSRITLPGYQWTDEEFVRAHADLASTGADLVTEYTAGNQCLYRVNGVGQIYEETSWRNLTETCQLAVLSVEAIRAYLWERTPETGRRLLLDLWEARARSLARAKEEVAARQAAEAAKEQALADARALLKPEIDKLATDLAYWKKAAQEALVRLKEIEDEADDTEDDDDA